MHGGFEEVMLRNSRPGTLAGYITEVGSNGGFLLSGLALTMAECSNYQLCRKNRFPWKRQVISYGRPCSGDEIINTTQSTVYVDEQFTQLKNNYMTSLHELSWQIQNLTFLVMDHMPDHTNTRKPRIVHRKGKLCTTNSVLLTAFGHLSEIGLYMTLIRDHFSVVMDFPWNEDQLLIAMCSLKKIYHRHHGTEPHSNTLLQSFSNPSLCIKHTTGCAKFYVWLQDKLQGLNNKMGRVFSLSRRFVIEGQYHVR